MVGGPRGSPRLGRGRDEGGSSDGRGAGGRGAAAPNGGAHCVCCVGELLGELLGERRSQKFWEPLKSGAKIPRGGRIPLLPIVQRTPRSRGGRAGHLRDTSSFFCELIYLKKGLARNWGVFGLGQSKAYPVFELSLSWAHAPPRRACPALDA